MSPWLSDLYLRAQSDARLLSLARDGQDRAFTTIAERYRAELLAHAGRLSANGAADDLLQQTLLSAFAALRGGAEVGHLRGWLHAILRHAAIRAHAPAEAPLELAAHTGETPDALLEARADVREVLCAVDDLPARQREALIGSTVQGLSRAELASALGVSEGAVRQLVHRARIAVRAAITSLTPYSLARWLADAASAPGGSPEAVVATGAIGAGGALAKVGMVAAAGAIAATGLAAAGHSPSRPHARTPRPVVAARGRARDARTGESAVASAVAVVPVSGPVSAPAATATPLIGAGRGAGGRARGTDPAGARGRSGSTGHGEGRQGLPGPRQGGGSTGDGGSRGTVPLGGSSGLGRAGSDGGGSGRGGSDGAGSGRDGSDGGGSGTGTNSGTAGSTASPPAATAASGTDSGSGGGSGGGGRSPSPSSGPGSGADGGGSAAATSTTPSDSRDLFAPAGSSVATEN